MSRDVDRRRAGVIRLVELGRRDLVDHDGQLDQDGLGKRHRGERHAHTRARANGDALAGEERRAPPQGNRRLGSQVAVELVDLRRDVDRPRRQRLRGRGDGGHGQVGEQPNGGARVHGERPPRRSRRNARVDEDEPSAGEGRKLDLGDSARDGDIAESRRTGARPAGCACTDHHRVEPSSDRVGPLRVGSRSGDR